MAFENAWYFMKLIPSPTMVGAVDQALMKIKSMGFQVDQARIDLYQMCMEYFKQQSRIIIGVDMLHNLDTLCASSMAKCLGVNLAVREELGNCVDLNSDRENIFNISVLNLMDVKLGFVEFKSDGVSVNRLGDALASLEIKQDSDVEMLDADEVCMQID